MKRFKGFAAGKQQQIAVPAQFFDDLLPLIDDAIELKVTLFCFQALYQKQGQYRYLVLSDFTGHAPLMNNLTGNDEIQQIDSLMKALEKMVRRGTLLFTEVDTFMGDGDMTGVYFMNTARGREAYQQLRAGQWQLDTHDHLEVLPQRPNLFTLYEANIGLLTPLIADELTAAEESYPDNWLVDAIKLAVEHNKRNWRYIHAILKRWQQEGKDSHETSGGVAAKDGADYAGGRYADIIES